MTFRELIDLELFTCEVRFRLYDLMDAGFITLEDYTNACKRYSSTWKVIDEYLETHEVS